jgi:hypothetical protein
MALDHLLDHRGLESLQGLGIFLLTTASRPALGSTQSPIQWVPRVLSLEVKRTGREADQLPRSRMLGAIPPFPQYAPMAWRSVKEFTGTTLPLPLKVKCKVVPVLN